MGWGEPHVRNAGTTGEIEEAHKAFDSLGIESGSLANRTLILTKRIERDATPSLTRSGVECNYGCESEPGVRGCPVHDWHKGEA